MDLVLAHLGMTAFFAPMRFLANAPPQTYDAVLYTALVIYIICFYIGMCLIKLSSSPCMQVVAMVMMFCYMAVYYGAGILGQLIVESGLPHFFWTILNFIALMLIVLKERTRISNSDPLDYNYTHEQKIKLRAFERSGGLGGTSATNAMRKTTTPHVEFSSMEEGKKKSSGVRAGGRTIGGSTGSSGSTKGGSSSRAGANYTKTSKSKTKRYGVY